MHKKLTATLPIEVDLKELLELHFCPIQIAWFTTYCPNYRDKDGNIVCTAVGGRA